MTPYKNIVDHIYAGPFPEDRNYISSLPKQRVHINLSREQLVLESEISLFHRPFCYWQFKNEHKLNQYILEVVNIISQYKQRKIEIYINCRLGIDRCAVIVVCYFIVVGYSAEQAKTIYYSRRDCRQILNDANQVIDQFEKWYKTDRQI